MTSTNNWLGFSLSPQELNSQTHHHEDHESHNSVFNSDEISGAQVSSPFSIFEGFNKNTTQYQDWNNMREVGMDSFSCNSQNLQENQERPKLENFLGNSFNTDYHHEQGNFQVNNIPQASTIYYHPINGHESSYNINNNGNIGLSMIKNWLRNNPAPPHATENEAPPPEAQGGCVQSLSLSMSTTGSQSSAPLNGNALESCTSDRNKVQHVIAVEGTTQNAGGAVESAPRKSIDTFGQRTSIYRGVTKHRWTGRYEAHLWDNSCRREGQSRKGRQVYLGGYDKEEKAARAYDLSALKYWGATTTTNFPTSNYEKEIEEMKNMTRQEFIASIRRKSSGFSRGASIYRGVTRHHQHGRWQARIGRVAGNKDLYLGTFSTQEEAAEAYDIAAIKFRGLNAVTNFEMNHYDVTSILESTTLPIGGAAKRLKDAENAEMALLEMHRANEGSLNLHLDGHGWPNIAFQSQAYQPLASYPYGAHPTFWRKQEQQSNIMSLDSSTIEYSAGSDSSIYGSGANGSFAMPTMGMIDGQDHHGSQNGFVNDEEKYEGMFGSTDGYQQARSLYYQSPQFADACLSHNRTLYRST